MKSHRNKDAEIRLDLVIPAAVVVLVALALWLALRPLASRTTVPSGDPAPIRLVGVQPDCSDDLYDAEGRKVGTRFLDTGSDWRWGANTMRRDFIFELMDPHLQLLSASLEVRVSPNYVHSQSAQVRRRPDGRTELIAECNMTSYYYRRSMFSGRRPISHVDLHLFYTLSEQGEPLARFAGPFTVGQAYLPTNGCTLTVTNEAADSRSVSAQFHLAVTGLRFQHPLSPVVAVDQTGKRHPVQTHHWSGSPQRTDLGFRVPGVALTNIQTIIVEWPREKVFPQVLVRYPDCVDRYWPEYEDKLMTALQLKMPIQQFQSYQFKSPDEVIRVIELLRGRRIRSAVDVLFNARDKFKIASLPPESQERIRRAARTWAQTSTHFTDGIRLGLRGPWPEFVDPAIDGMERLDNDYRRDEAAYALSQSGLALTPDQAKRIARWIPREPSASARQYLVTFLQTQSTPAGVTGLIELARQQQIWIWAPANRALFTLALSSAYRGDVSFLEDPLIVSRRVLLTGETNWTVRGRQCVLAAEEAQRALQQLPGLLTVELRERDPSVCSSVYEQIVARVDRAAATAAIVQHLRGNPRPEQSSWITAQMVRRLNAWHDQNFGHLGAQAPNADRSHELKAEDWQRIIGEVAAWYDRQPKPTAATSR